MKEAHPQPLFLNGLGSVAKRTITFNGGEEKVTKTGWEKLNPMTVVRGMKSPLLASPNGGTAKRSKRSPSGEMEGGFFT